MEDLELYFPIVSPGLDAVAMASLLRRRTCSTNYVSCRSTERVGLFIAGEACV